MTTDHITQAELREHYASTDLAARGISFDQAMQAEATRRALYGAVRAQRKAEARRAIAAPLAHQVIEKEAA